MACEAVIAPNNALNSDPRKISARRLARACVPGCFTARRFETKGGTHKHAAIYHLSAPEVCASQAWKEAAGTPWTDKMRPHFRDVMRLVFRRYTRKA